MPFAFLSNISKIKKKVLNLTETLQIQNDIILKLFV